MAIRTAAQTAKLQRESMESLKTQPRVESARYVPETGNMEFTMVGGSRIVTPARKLKGFTDETTDEVLSDVKPMSYGTAIHWDTADVQHTTIALIESVFNLKTHHTTAKNGGRAKSEAKTAAVRANGAKGGRPRKTPAPA